MTNERAPLCDKTWSTLQAEAALVGVDLRQLRDGMGNVVFVATRVDSAASHQLADRSSLHAFLARLRAEGA